MMARPVDSLRQVQTPPGNENRYDGETKFRKRVCPPERSAARKPQLFLWQDIVRGIQHHTGFPSELPSLGSHRSLPTSRLVSTNPANFTQARLWRLRSINLLDPLAWAQRVCTT